MSVDLHALRPSDDAVDAEFDPTRRAALLAGVRDQSEMPPHRRRIRPRRLILVAATVLLLTGAGGLADQLISRLPGADLLPVRAQPAAANGLDELARRAARTTSTTAPLAGEYLASVTVDQQSGQPLIRHESYTAPDGWTWRKDTERGRHTWYLYPTSAQLDIGNLPTDSDELEATLRKQWLGTRSDDQGLFKLIGEIAQSENASPEVRAATLRILAEMAEETPGVRPDRKGGETAPLVTVLDGTLSGRPVTGARFTDNERPGGQLTYWFDPSTSQLVRTDQQLSDGSTFVSEVRSRNVVEDLPRPIKDKLGTGRTEKVEK